MFCLLIVDVRSNWLKLTEFDWICVSERHIYSLGLKRHYNDNNIIKVILKYISSSVYSLILYYTTNAFNQRFLEKLQNEIIGGCFEMYVYQKSLSLWNKLISTFCVVICNIFKELRTLFLNNYFWNQNKISEINPAVLNC